MNKLLTPLVLAVLVLSGCEEAHVEEEVIAVGEYDDTFQAPILREVFAGTLNHAPVIPGSLQVRGAGITFVDDGNGNLIGERNTWGTVEYRTGVWTLHYENANAFGDFGDVGVGVPIVASYSYYAPSQ